MTRRLPPAADSSAEMVLTIPGFLAGRDSMQRLSIRLCEAGYSTCHWGYPSLRGSMLKHAVRLSADLIELAASSRIRRIHLVTHSMGGVIARAALSQSGIQAQWPEKCGRMVMLAPPNAGSRLTRIPLGPLAPWFPQLKELSESPDSLACRMAPPKHFAVGVIAAARDFVVTASATHLVGQREHGTVPTTHQRLPSHREAIEMTLRFLKSESFHTAPSELSMSTQQQEQACPPKRVA